MNKRYIIFGALVGIITLVASCGKEGFDFKDGYQEGDDKESPILSDTTMGKVDKSLYNRARIYPGLVGENVNRIQDTTLSLLMDKVHVSAYDYKVSYTPPPIYSTGLYAPAGETVRINVPQGAIGMTVQIGVHTDNIAGKDAPRRDAVIYTKKELFPGNNYVGNLYGGTIWIINAKHSSIPIDLKVTGAVKATDFVLGKTSVSDWKKQVLAHDVPWMDLIGKRTAFTVPRSLVVKFIQSGKMDHVDEALELWDESYVKDYYNWMGLSADAVNPINRYPSLWERGVMDIHPSAGYAHSGNPWIMQEDEYWLDELTNPNTIKKGTSWGSYHEVGHNYQAGNSWSWSDLGETTNNIFIFNAARNRGETNRTDFHPALKTAIPSALNYAKSSGPKNFSNFPAGFGVDKDNAAFARITPFLQIFDKVKGRNGESGWDFFPYIYTKARNENFFTSLEQAKRDYFYRQLCHFAGVDFDRFFNAWGIPVSASAKREIRNVYAPMTTSLWEYDPLNYTGGDSPLPPKYDLDRTSWTIMASSEYPAEGGGNGVVTALTDNKTTSFWMSNTANNPPHILTVDMTESSAIKGLYYQARDAGNNVPKSVRIEVSTDNVKWTLLDSDELQNASDYTYNTTLNSYEIPTGDKTRKEFAFKKIYEVRYIRFTFPDETSWAGSKFVGVAEIGAFYDN
ncbi:M60 family metallopeptidase [Sphingobacterium faecium]|uniref:M60 family metallopeptidase n=1 Tax=Sphingobacterium faecium TaxID=34087 RepID=UPI00246873C9|nr:M60 family metallopeptidase [Sphingobacterium faecium]MDH5828160.1 M60 family metallopeptidase [Sphingobacterium faecium]